MKPYLKLFILALFPLGMLQPSFAEEPLPPDDAFKLKVSFKDKNTLVAELASAKNHYLYKNKELSCNSSLFSTFCVAGCG